MHNYHSPTTRHHHNTNTSSQPPPAHHNENLNIINKQIQKQPTINKVNISFMGDNVNNTTNLNASPHGDAYKSSKRTNQQSSLEYQYASNVNSISRGGGFFPNLRSKGANGAISQPRETGLAQNGSNSVFLPLNNPKQTRMLALPILNEQLSLEDEGQKHSSSTQ